MRSICKLLFHSKEIQFEILLKRGTCWIEKRMEGERKYNGRRQRKKIKKER
jgi:hypothetical protein